MVSEAPKPGKPPPRYRISLKSSAVKELGKLGKDLQLRVAEAIGELAAEPRPNGSVKLSGSASDYRIRVGAYRVV